MAKSRMEAVEVAGKEAKNKNLGRYYWVDIDKLERHGIVNWTPKEGANFISVIPPIDDTIFYAREVYVHYSVGGDKGPTHLCMKETKDVKTKKKWGKPCAVCDMRHKLAANSATRESAEELKPSRRFLFYIVDTSELPEDATIKEMEKAKKKVVWYDASPTFRDCITGASENKRKGGWIDVSDPDSGKTVCFDREGKGMKTKYKNFALEVRATIPDSWLEVPDYDDVLLIPDYDEVASEVDLISGGGSSEESEGRPRSRGAGSVGEDEPSGDDDSTPRRRRPSADDEVEKVEEDKVNERGRKEVDSKEVKEDPPEEEPEKPKEETSDNDSGDDEVEAIKRRIREKRAAKDKD